MTPEKIEDVYQTAKRMLEQAQAWDTAWAEAEADEKAKWDAEGHKTWGSQGFYMAVRRRVRAATGFVDRTPADTEYSGETFAKALVVLKEGQYCKPDTQQDEGLYYTGLGEAAKRMVQYLDSLSCCTLRLAEAVMNNQDATDMAAWVHRSAKGTKRWADYFMWETTLYEDADAIDKAAKMEEQG